MSIHPTTHDHTTPHYALPYHSMPYGVDLYAPTYVTDKNMATAALWSFTPTRRTWHTYPHLFRSLLLFLSYFNIFITATISPEVNTTPLPPPPQHIKTMVCSGGFVFDGKGGAESTTYLRLSLFKVCILIRK